METLEKESPSPDRNFEDFKARSNQLLTQDVIRKEVGLAHHHQSRRCDQILRAHKQDFVRPEMVVLREIFVSTERARGDIPTLRKKAENLRDRVLKNGDDFGNWPSVFQIALYRAAVGRTRRLRAVQIDQYFRKRCLR